MIWIAPSEKNSLTATLETRLWDSADQFRANSGLKAQEYSGPILGIIFLRFAEVRFAAQRAKLENASVAGEPRDAGLLGRETKGEVVLVPRLRAAVEKLNPTLPPEAIAAASLEQIDTLENQMQNLRRMRDLLLWTETVARPHKPRS
jgi:type I restriction-modification system DNA methylase subunit